MAVFPLFLELHFIPWPNDAYQVLKVSLVSLTIFHIGILDRIKFKNENLNLTRLTVPDSYLMIVLAAIFLVLVLVVLTDQIIVNFRFTLLRLLHIVDNRIK